MRNKIDSMIRDRTKVLLQKQESMDNRVRREQFQASKDAQAKGLASSDQHAFVD